MFTEKYKPSILEIPPAFLHPSTQPKGKSHGEKNPKARTATEPVLTKREKG